MALINGAHSVHVLRHPKQLREPDIPYPVVAQIPLLDCLVILYTSAQLIQSSPSSTNDTLNADASNTTPAAVSLRTTHAEHTAFY